MKLIITDIEDFKIPIQSMFYKTGVQNPGLRGVPELVSAVEVHLFRLPVQNQDKAPEHQLIVRWEILRKRYSRDRQMKNAMQISGFRGLYTSSAPCWVGA